MKTKFFFVYGTLKVGGVFAEHFDIYRLSAEKATLNNMDLYNIGWFPGILPGKGTVVGELHEYREPDIVLEHMDQIEGYNRDKDDLFIRKSRSVVTETGKNVEATVYIFNGTNVPTDLIKSGVWDLNRGE